MSEELLGTILLTDEDDNEIEFDVMDKFPYKGMNYYILLPVDYDADDVEFVILREDTVDGETALMGIDDVETLDAVFDEYKRRQQIE